MKYRGNLITCSSCKYSPQFKIGDKIEYEGCKNLDHHKLRLYTKIFSGYSGSIHSCHICNKYTPAEWDISGQNEWTDIDDYIDFMQNEYYRYGDKVKCIKTTKTGSVIICIGGYDCYGEIHYIISLYDWLKGEWLKNDKIKYLYKKKVIRTSKGKPKTTELISNSGVDDLRKYLETNHCDYLLV